MEEMECPLCGCQRFYVKDSDDEYETHEFNLRDGKIVFDKACSGSNRPEILDESDTYCHRCSWHGKFKTLKSAR